MPEASLHLAPPPLRVLGVNGSLHEKGVTLAVLTRFLHLVRQRGAETRLLDLRVVELPLYSPDRHGHAAVRERVAAEMNWAQALVLASPDYHGSMSGAMKNFMDYSWAECAGKLFAYICSSHEKGLTVMEQMRTVVRQCYGWSLPYGASFDPKTDQATEDALLKKAGSEARATRASEAERVSDASFDERVSDASPDERVKEDATVPSEGDVFSPRVEQRLRMMARDLVIYGALLVRRFDSDLAGDEPDTFAAVYRKLAAPLKA